MMLSRGVQGLGALAQPPQVMVPVPQPNGTVTQMPTAETSLANAAVQDANDYMQFVATTNAPNYATPADYLANMIEYARELCWPSWGPYVCPAGYDPVAMGTKYANVVFAALKNTPYSGTNVYAYWVAHPVAQSYATPPPNTPYNPGSVPGSSVLPTPPPNTLPGVAPVPVSVTPAPGTNVLNPPPQNWFPLNPTQIQNGTTGGSILGLPDLSGATAWLQTNWMPLAAGLAAIVILPSLLGGKR